MTAAIQRTVQGRPKMPSSIWPIQGKVKLSMRKPPAPGNDGCDALDGELVPGAHAFDVIQRAQAGNDEAACEQADHARGLRVEELRDAALCEPEGDERCEEADDHRDAAEARDHLGVNTTTTRVVDDAHPTCRGADNRREERGNREREEQCAYRCVHRSHPGLCAGSNNGRAA